VKLLQTIVLLFMRNKNRTSLGENVNRKSNRKKL